MTVSFSAYFSTIAEKIPFNSSMNFHSAPDFAYPINYLKQVFSRPFPGINLTPTTAKEITEIVKSHLRTLVVTMKFQAK